MLSLTAGMAGVLSSSVGKAQVSSEGPGRLAEMASGSGALQELEDVSLVALMDAKVESATKTSMSVREAPSVVTVISRQEIDAYGFFSIGQALSMVPGLFVVDDGVTSNVSIRGISAGPDSWSRGIKVMVDGVPVTYYDTGGTLLGPEFLPMAAVERIEVIKGPASALYGANAFLGVVNVVTRDATRADDVRGSILEGTARLGADAQNGHFGEGTGELLGGASTGGEHPASFLASVRYSRLDRSGLSVPDGSPNAEDYAGQVSEEDISTPKSIFAKASWDLDSIGSFHVTYVQQDLNAGAQFSVNSVLSDVNRKAYRNQVGAFTYRNEFFEDRLRVEAFYRRTEGETRPDNLIDNGSDSVVLEADRFTIAHETGGSVGLHFDPHSLIAGVEYLEIANSGGDVYQFDRDGMSDAIFRTSSAPVRIENVGVYLQGLARPWKQLGLIGGLRYDHNTQWKDSFNVRAGGVYSPLGHLNVKALFGTSFVPPAPVLLNAAPTGTGTVRGNPDLESQSARTGELSINYAVLPGLSMDGSLFYTNIDDRVEFINSTGSNLSAENLTSSTSVGTEMVVNADAQFVYSRMGVTAQSTSIADPEERLTWWRQVFPDDSSNPLAKQPTAVPVWRVDGSLGFRLPRYYMQGVLTGHYVGPRKSSVANIRRAGEAYYLSPYATFDLTVQTMGFEPFEGRPTSLVLQALNVTGTRYAEAGSLGVDIPGRPRTISMTWRQEF